MSNLKFILFKNEFEFFKMNVCFFSSKNLATCSLNFSSISSILERLKKLFDRHEQNKKKRLKIKMQKRFTKFFSWKKSEILGISRKLNNETNLFLIQKFWRRFNFLLNIFELASKFLYQKQNHFNKSSRKFPEIS